MEKSNRLGYEKKWTLLAKFKTISQDRDESYLFVVYILVGERALIDDVYCKCGVLLRGVAIGRKQGRECAPLLLVPPAPFGDLL